MLLLALLLVCSLPGFVQPKSFPSYLVIGQQKCGTSSLWALMRNHPQLAKGSVGGGKKEPTFFQKQHVFSYGRNAERCDRSVSQYLNLWEDLKEGEMAGDFSVAHLSCYCCPEVFHDIIPQAKIIAILRDPVSRALSRFVEQYNWPYKGRGFLDKEVHKYANFGEYAETELEDLRACLFLAEKDLPDGGNHTQVHWMQTYQCFMYSNIIGWSVYSVFLERWLRFYPKEQLLVLYTTELESKPEATLRKVETFLGIKAHSYDPKLLTTKFNSKHNYGWGVGSSSSSSNNSGSGSNSSGSGNSSNKSGSGSSSNNSGSGNSSSSSAETKEGSPLKDAVLKLKAAGQSFERKRDGERKSAEELEGDLRETFTFMKPYMDALMRMADEGIIARIPEEILKPYSHHAG